MLSLVSSLPFQSFFSKVSKSPVQSTGALFLRDSNRLKIGLVGCANIGKTATFNFLTESTQPSENYPFCTIDPFTASCIVKDTRLDRLAEIYQPKTVLHSAVQFVDIAGLVPGASDGAGLGNAFLSHIKSVDGIAQVVRVFEDDNVAHTEGTLNPIRDLNIIRNELFQKDTQDLKSALTKAQKKRNSKESTVIEKALELISNNKSILQSEWKSDEIPILRSLQILSSKPNFVLVNLGWEEYIDYAENKPNPETNSILKTIQEWCDAHLELPNYVIPYSAILETAAIEGDEDSQKLSAVDKIVETGFNLLNLQQYFTCGPQEVRSWTIRKGTTAIDASSIIHTSFPSRFIKAQVASYGEFENLKDSSNYKKGIHWRTEGKSYVVEDGDICLFQLTK